MGYLNYFKYGLIFKGWYRFIGFKWVKERSELFFLVGLKLYLNGYIGGWMRFWVFSVFVISEFCSFNIFCWGFDFIIGYLGYC